MAYRGLSRAHDWSFNAAFFPFFPAACRLKASIASKTGCFRSIGLHECQLKTRSIDLETLKLEATLEVSGLRYHPIRSASVLLQQALSKAIIMPATTIPPVSHYESPPVTQEDCASILFHDIPSADIPCAVDYADFPIIDISKAQTPQGRKELAPVVRDAMRTYGFLYIVNHGLKDAKVRTLETPQTGIVQVVDWLEPE